MKRVERILWLAAGLWALAALVPGSYWYDAHEMRVDDIVQGDRLELLYSGGPLRAFVGSYSVVVRDTVARTIVGEDRRSGFTYQTDGTRPSPLTIEYWAPGDVRMHNLPPGSYQMQTCWTVLNAFWGLVPGKTTCVNSNIFRVHESALAAVRPTARPHG